jgi:hypothetical protein
MPKVESKMRYVDHIEGSGTEFFRLACEHDLERIVGKWKFGSYCADGAQTSWVKVKTRLIRRRGRHELFEKRNGGMRRSAKVKSPLRCSAILLSLSGASPLPTTLKGLHLDCGDDERHEL